MTDEERERGRVLLWAFFCAVLCVMLVAWRVRGAPVPPPRRAPAPSLAGSWACLWSGSEWPTVMLPDGTYVAERPGGPRYEGSWALAGGRLTISERLVESGRYGPLNTCTFEMRPGRRASRCGGLRLAPARGR